MATDSPAIPLSLRKRFDVGARVLMQGVGEAALYVATTGERWHILAALDENAVSVGQDFGVTTVGRPAIDLLKSDVPSPNQGDRIILDDGEWVVDGKDSDDGHIVRVWVSSP